MRYSIRHMVMMILVLCVLIGLASGLKANVSAVTTKINNEIDLGLQKEIFDIQNTLFERINAKDYDGVEKLISPKLSGLKGFDLTTFVNQASPFFSHKKFVVSDQYHSILAGAGEEEKATIVPSLSDKSKLIINNHTFYGEESYNLFLKSTTPGWQYLAFLSLSRFSGEWKFNIIHLGNYSIRFQTAPMLYDLGLQAKAGNRVASCVVYAWAINKFLRPAPYLQYMDEQKYAGFIKSSLSKMNETFQFPFTIDGTSIIGFQIETTDNEGLIPIVLYLTGLDFKDPNIKKNALGLKEKVLQRFYGLDHDFEYLVMRAYNEMPIDPQKKYNVHGTVIKLKE